MKLPWKRNERRDQIEKAREFADSVENELQEVKKQWPLVNKISSEMEEQLDTNHFGQLLKVSMRKRGTA